MQKKKKKFKPLSERNKERAILYGFLAVLSLVVLKNFFFPVIFTTLCVLNVHLMMKAKSSEEALIDKMKKSEETMDEDLSKSERKFMQRYTNSDEDIKKRNEDWISQRIREMDEEDALYDSLESEEDIEEYEDE